MSHFYYTCLERSTDDPELKLKHTWNGLKWVRETEKGTQEQEKESIFLPQNAFLSYISHVYGRAMTDHSERKA